MFNRWSIADTITLTLFSWNDPCPHATEADVGVHGHWRSSFSYKGVKCQLSTTVMGTVRKTKSNREEKCLRCKLGCRGKKHVKLDKSRLRHSFSRIYSSVSWNEGDWTLSASVLLFKWDEISTQHRSSVNHKFFSIPMELSFLYSEQRCKDSLTVFYDSVNFMADLFSKIVSFSSKSNFLPDDYPFCDWWHLSTQHAACSTWCWLRWKHMTIKLWQQKVL